MPKEVWHNKEFQTGKVKIVNRAAGKYAPKGQKIKVIWKDGAKIDSTEIDIDKSFIITPGPNSDKIYIDIKPLGVQNMDRATLTVKRKALYYDYMITVSESGAGCRLTLSSNKRDLGFKPLDQ